MGVIFSVAPTEQTYETVDLTAQVQAQAKAQAEAQAQKAQAEAEAEAATRARAHAQAEKQAELDRQAQAAVQAELDAQAEAAVRAQMEATIPAEFIPLVQLDMNFLRGINANDRVGLPDIQQQLACATVYHTAYTRLFNNLVVILRYEPFGAIKKSFTENLKHILTANNTELTYIINPITLANHINMTDNALVYFVQNVPKKKSKKNKANPDEQPAFTEKERIEICTSLWSFVNTAAADCLSVIHNLTAFYANENAMLKTMNLNQSTSDLQKISTLVVPNLNKFSGTADMSEAINSYMNTYATLASYSTEITKKTTCFQSNLAPMAKKDLQMVSPDVIPQTQTTSSAIQSVFTNTVLPALQSTGTEIVTDLAEKIINTDNVSQIEVGDLVNWVREIGSNKVMTLVGNSTDVSQMSLAKHAISYVNPLIDTYVPDKMLSAMIKGATKTTLTNVETRVKAAFTPKTPVPAASVAPMTPTVVIPTVSVEHSSVNPKEVDKIRADGITSTTITVLVRDAQNNPMAGQIVTLKACDRPTNALVLPSMRITGSDGSALFSVTNNVCESVMLTAHTGDQRVIGNVLLNFIPATMLTLAMAAPAVVPSGNVIACSYFNNTLIVKVKTVPAVVTKVQLAYTISVSSTCQNSKCETKETDYTGTTSFYEVQPNATFTLTVDGVAFTGCTSSAIIALTPVEAETAVEPAEIAVEPAEIAVEDDSVVEPAETAVEDDPVVEPVEPVEPIEDDTEIEEAIPYSL